jgi:hypothetical protein
MEISAYLSDTKKIEIEKRHLKISGSGRPRTLNLKQVLEIVCRLRAGEAILDIASLFKTTRESVLRIIKHNKDTVGDLDDKRWGL